MNKKKLIKVGIVVGIITVVMGVGLFRDSERPVNGIMQVGTELTTFNVGYDYIHKMTNSVINSNNIWGTIQVNKSNLDKLKNSELYKTDKKIQEYVNQWLEGDFTNSDKFHNYVWNKLGGTIGRASSNNLEEIEKVKERLR